MCLDYELIYLFWILTVKILRLKLLIRKYNNVSIIYIDLLQKHINEAVRFGSIKLAIKCIKFLATGSTPLDALFMHLKEVNLLCSSRIMMHQAH